LGTTFFYQLIFDIPQLTQFVRRTPKFKAHDEAILVLSYSNVSLTLQQRFGTKIALGISCRKIDWQLLSLVQICTSLSPLFSTVEHLYIGIDSFSPLPRWKDDIENGPWLDLLRPFAVVKNLYFSWQIASCIVAALQELIEESVTIVLPALQSLIVDRLNLSGPVQEAMGQFVAARQLAGRPIAVSHRDGAGGFGSDMPLVLPYLKFP
jgi:hypothetical protein